MQFTTQKIIQILSNATLNHKIPGIKIFNNIMAHKICVNTIHETTNN